MPLDTVLYHVTVKQLRAPDNVMIMLLNSECSENTFMSWLKFDRLQQQRLLRPKQFFECSWRVVRCAASFVISNM